VTKGDIDIDFSVRKARRSARWAEEEGLLCDTESREWAKEYGRAIDRGFRQHGGYREKRDSSLRSE
jgi:hypothetical protein